MTTTGTVVEQRTIKTETAEVRAGSGGAKTIVGYAARFNHYSDNLGGFVEVLRPGAFSRAVNDDRIKGKYEHELTLARSGAGTLRVTEDNEGLYYEIDINTRDSEAMNALARIERGDVAFSSFAFTLTPDGDTWGETEQGFPLREIVPAGVARLYDVSPVSDPAYAATDVAARALARFADAHHLERSVATTAAQSGDLIDLIRGGRNIGGAQIAVPGPKAAAAPVVSVRLEMERMAARRRQRARLSGPR